MICSVVVLKNGNRQVLQHSLSVFFQPYDSLPRISTSFFSWILWHTASKCFSLTNGFLDFPGKKTGGTRWKTENTSDVASGETLWFTKWKNPSTITPTQGHCITKTPYMADVLQVFYATLLLALGWFFGEIVGDKHQKTSWDVRSTIQEV